MHIKDIYNPNINSKLIHVKLVVSDKQLRVFKLLRQVPDARPWQYTAIDMCMLVL